MGLLDKTHHVRGYTTGRRGVGKTGRPVKGQRAFRAPHERMPCRFIATTRVAIRPTLVERHTNTRDSG